MIQQMTAIPVQSIQAGNTVSAAKQPTPAEATKSFGEFLEQAIEGVTAQEQASKEMTSKFMIGQADVSQVMIASEQAQLSLQLTTQIRNRVVEAYQDIMRMQL